jgi:hypothetical protein
MRGISAKRICSWPLLTSAPILLQLGFGIGMNTEPCTARTCNGQRQACIASEARLGRTDPLGCVNAYTLCLKSGVWGNPAGAAIKSCSGLARR